MKRFLLNVVLITFGCLLLFLMLIVGVWNGWIGMRGRPIQKVRQLQEPAIERQHQIEDLANP